MSDIPYRRHRVARPEKKKAPWFVRWFAWTALILLFLAFGFYGSGAIFTALDKKGMLPVDGVISTAKDVPQVLNVSDQENVTVSKNLDLTIYNLFKGGLGQGKLRIISDYQEADINAALAASFQSSDVASIKGLRPSHLFRDGVTLYVDMPGAFVNALADLDSQSAFALRDAIGRTIVENFSPINRVIFLTDGRHASDVNDLPLSQVWEAARQ